MEENFVRVAVTALTCEDVDQPVSDLPPPLEAVVEFTGNSGLKCYCFFCVPHPKICGYFVYLFPNLM